MATVQSGCGRRFEISLREAQQPSARSRMRNAARVGFRGGDSGFQGLRLCLRLAERGNGR